MYSTGGGGFTTCSGTFPAGPDAGLVPGGVIAASSARAARRARDGLRQALKGAATAEPGSCRTPCTTRCVTTHDRRAAVATCSAEWSSSKRSSLPGLGLLVYQSISPRLPVIQAGVLVSAVAFVLINIVVDSLHGLIDSRVRTS